MYKDFPANLIINLNLKLVKKKKKRVLASMICIVLVIKIFFNSINHLELITPDKKVKCLFMD